MKRNTLTNEQVEGYLNQGYLTLNGLFPLEAIEDLRAELLRLARGDYPCPGLAVFPQSVPAEQVWESLVSFHEPHRLSDRVEHALLRPDLVQVLTRIVGAHLLGWDGRVKLLHSMLYLKPPQMLGHPWHQDETYFPTRDRSLTAVYVALDKVTRSNGCLWVVPRSHRQGYVYPRGPHGAPQEFLFAEESQGFLPEEAIPLEMPAGAVTFFNGYLLHKSNRNSSSGPRPVLVGHYCNAWSLVPDSVPEGTPALAMAEAIGSADDRRVVPVCGEDPYAWKGHDCSLDNVLLRRR